MRKKSLLKTNPYLADPDESKRLIFTSVSSSSAIEGVHIKAFELAIKGEVKKKPSVSRSASKSSVIR